MKTRFRLTNLDCANCAVKIEQHLRSLPGLQDSTVNFATMCLTTDTDDLKRLRREIKSIEPDVDIKPWRTAQFTAASEQTLNPLQNISIISVSILLLTILLLFENRLHEAHLGTLEYVIAGVAYLLSGWNVLKSAFRTIMDRQWFNEHVLMTIATMGAFAIHALEEAVGVMVFYQIGELLQNMAVSKSRTSISALLEIRPDYANLRTGSETKRVSPESVNAGDIIVIRAGEKIPLDGEVIDGTSQINTSVLTGESVPQVVRSGDKVLAGELAMTGMLTVKVTRSFSESSVTKILDLVENAAGKKAKTEQFMTRFSRYYTPAVVILASIIAVVPPLLIPDQSFTVWVYRALVLLVISCPCALIVSIPLGYFGGIGGASRQGILVKGSNFLDALSRIKSVVFDKTGTLTKGVFKVRNIVPSENYDENEVLRCAAIAEYNSNHPIAKSIVQAFTERGGSFDDFRISEHHEISGYGVKSVCGNQTFTAGNDALLHMQNIAHPVCETEGSVVHVSNNGNYMGYIYIGDELKEDALLTIKSLRDAGIKDISMLTGDNFKAASEVASKLTLDRFFSSLLPEQKVSQFEKILNEKDHDGLVAFVGDGINDAPVIARADVGIAMGALGSDAAIETADVVLMTDDPSKIVQAVHIGKHTRSIILQNIIMALGIKLIFVGLGSMGLAGMWEAVFADMGVAVLAVLNSSRALNVSRL
ncbi:MAG: cadmium-translocating P-type ATPase [Fibrobacter sp.]|nr:cadmium-translocating P-type ATPase [Fibrobacter sp.]